MKTIIVVTVVETLMLTLWLAYSHYRGRKSNLRIALGRLGPTFDHREGSLLSPSPGHRATFIDHQHRTTDGP